MGLCRFWIQPDRVAFLRSVFPDKIRFKFPSIHITKRIVRATYVEQTEAYYPAVTCQSIHLLGGIFVIRYKPDPPEPFGICLQAMLEVGVMLKA